MKYRVVIRDSNTKHLLLEADSEQQAIERAGNLDAIALSSGEEIDGVEVAADEDNWEILSASPETEG